MFLDGRSGFNGFVGNPPFIGGMRITAALGSIFLRHIRTAFPSSRGTADICAIFFLQAFKLLTTTGSLGLIATNTISQGDTRETSLDFITQEKQGTIYRAFTSIQWPGTAAVTVSVLNIAKSGYVGEIVLDHQKVEQISSFLDSSAAAGNPERLKSNADLTSVGSLILGTGFILDDAEACHLLDRDIRNHDVIFPYLVGQDLNQLHDQRPSRWVINFGEMSLSSAAFYEDCLAIIKERVKPERDKVTYSKSAKEKWWQYERTRSDVYEKLKNSHRFFAVSRVTKYFAPSA